MPLVPHSKISIPALPPEFVTRPALSANLDAAGTADGITLVCAPAGYGKTLLLADWALSSAAVDTAWVSLDRDDNDPSRLWASVVAALAACPSVPADSPLRDPGRWRTGAQPEFLADFVDALQALPRHIRLVLDDVHELVDPETLRGVQFLTRNRPAGVHLVLSSRFDPPLSLPRLRLTGRLSELRIEQTRFSPAETAALLERSGLRLAPAQVTLLHQRTGGWAAGLRLAALGVAGMADPTAFLADFSGDERSVADYLVGEILSGLPADLQEFLRVISICDPIPTGLATELSGREEAGSLLDHLEHRTSLVSSGWNRDAYHIQELLRTYLVADLHRQGPRRVANLHSVAARWWADQNDAIRALDHAARSKDRDQLADMLHRFAVPLILMGDHGPLRRALAGMGGSATAADPWLALTSALTNLEAGELSAAQHDLRNARKSWPEEDRGDLTVLLSVTERLAGSCAAQPAASRTVDPDELPADPELEALARLSRGMGLLDRGDWAGARTEFEATLDLSRRHGFAHLAMQCLALLGVVAERTGDVRTMRRVSSDAVACASEHGWEASTWSVTATTLLASAALMRAEPTEAEHLSAKAMQLGPAASTPQLRLALQSVHGAAVFDGGHRAEGLAELQQARSDFGNRRMGPEQAAGVALREFRAALVLGHSAAARTAMGWLTDRCSEAEAEAEVLVMRAWGEAATGRHEHARTLVHPVVEGSSTALLPHTVVESLLLETSLAIGSGERPAARRALHTALSVAEPIDALRPFAQADPSIRELLVHQQQSFGTYNAFAQRAMAAGAGAHAPHTMLSERELTVLGLLPSLLSLDEMASDLTISVNTVKSHVRSIYSKLGVSSRRLAVLAAYENGLLTSASKSG